MQIFCSYILVSLKKTSQGTQWNIWNKYEVFLLTGISGKEGAIIGSAICALVLKLPIMTPISVIQLKSGIN